MANAQKRKKTKNKQSALGRCNCRHVVPTGILGVPKYVPNTRVKCVISVKPLDVRQNCNLAHHREQVNQCHVWLITIKVRCNSVARNQRGVAQSGRASILGEGRWFKSTPHDPKTMGRKLNDRQGSQPNDRNE